MLPSFSSTEVSLTVVPALACLNQYLASNEAVAMESEAATSIDDLLKSVELPQAPVTRSASAKRNASPPPPKEPLTFSLTPVSSLVLSGMGPHQIWEQLELRTKNVSGYYVVSAGKLMCFSMILRYVVFSTV